MQRTILLTLKSGCKPCVHKNAYKLPDDTLPKLRKIIPEAMDSINLRRFRKAKNYMIGYLEGDKAGSDTYIEKLINQYINLIDRLL